MVIHYIPPLLSYWLSMFPSLFFFLHNFAHATEPVLIKLGGEVLVGDDILEDPPYIPKKPISLDVQQVDIRQLVYTFAQVGETNIIVGEGVTGTVTAYVQQVPWDIALYAIIQSHGWSIQFIGDIWVISP